jgi:bacteriochlorophyll 4-vinyl reductase
MSEARIGRVLVASLHQAIGDELSDRVEFYENWLTTTGLREGTIGLARLAAALSFLRREEGDAYDRVTRRAGQYAADWSFENSSALERRIVRALPAGLRLRAALRSGGQLVTASYPGSRTIIKHKRGRASVDLRGSLFCEVREASALPLCGYYASAFDRLITLAGLSADVQVTGCRAAGAPQGCVVSVVLRGAEAGAPAAA